MLPSKIIFNFSKKYIRCFSYSKILFNEISSKSTSDKIKLITPVPDGNKKLFDPKLESIADSIVKLNLFEIAELSLILKEKLNLPDPSFLDAFSALPVATQKEEDEEKITTKVVQTSFKVKLIKYDEKQKVPLIKEIKNLLEGMNLVKAEKFVERAPIFVKENIPKDEAEKLKEALMKVGAIVEIE